MSFDTAWLDLREPADHAARAADLLRAFAEALPPAPRILDLGSGTGSTLRAVSALIPDAQWRLTDNDPALLAEAKRRAPGAQVEQIDLAADLERALAHDADAITASALIDLVSAEWIDRLVAGARGRIVYIALSYDGQEHWSPAHSDDGEILTAFQRHQRGDKGFGPALGPDAVPYLAAAFERSGYSVRTADSAWRLEAGSLMANLADGIAQAALESGATIATVDRWRSARKQAVACKIGHTDILGLQKFQ